MKKLGANVVRIHLQLGKFMEGAEKPNTTALEQLRTLVTLAEDVGPVSRSDRAWLLPQGRRAPMV